MHSVISKDEARMLVLSVGYQEAAKQTGINYATLRQWAKRFKWNQNPVHAKKTQSVTNVTCSPADALSNILQNSKQRSTLALARYSAAAAEEAAAHPRKLKISRAVRDVAAVHSTLWPEVQRSEILNLGILTGQVEIRDSPDRQQDGNGNELTP